MTLLYIIAAVLSTVAYIAFLRSDRLMDTFVTMQRHPSLRVGLASVAIFQALPAGILGGAWSLVAASLLIPPTV